MVNLCWELICVIRWNPDSVSLIILSENKWVLKSFGHEYFLKREIEILFLPNKFEEYETPMCTAWFLSIVSISPWFPGRSRRHKVQEESDIVHSNILIIKQTVLYFMLVVTLKPHWLLPLPFRQVNPMGEKPKLLIIVVWNQTCLVSRFSLKTD